jgi:uncharacterized membrane protein HdeD (DUF308 family)
MNTAAYSRSNGWSIAFGILLLIAGLLSIAAPAFAGVAAGVFFGWLVLLAGAAHLVYAWSQRGAGAVIWEILIGTAYLIAGLYLLFHPLAGMALLTLVLAVYILFEGIFELVVFSRIRHLRGAAWFLIDGLVSLFLAALIFFHWPSSSLWVIGTLVGISLFFSGLARTFGHSRWGLGTLSPAV